MKYLSRAILYVVGLIQAGIRKLFLSVRGYNVLRLHLHGQMADRVHMPGLMAALRGRRAGPALLDVVVALDRARKDERLEFVVVEMESLHCGLSRAEEIRTALAGARDAGKRVIVVLEEPGLTEYLAALGASEIVLAPAGSLNVSGMASEVMFLKGLLSKAGVEAQLAARGKYKSAREMFAEDEMTPANREMTEALVGDLYEQLIGEIARHRKLDPDAVRAALDTGPFLATQAVEAGLVDRTGYLDEIDEMLEEQLPKVLPLKLAPYLRLSVPDGRRLNVRPTPIAIVEVSGHIKSGRSTPSPEGGVRATGSRTFVHDIEKAAAHPAVEGVLLRVDSPGGSGLASDLMWRALGKVAKDKPVVISMSNVAASGGYYVSAIAPGCTILAGQSTITGSIGVLGGKFMLGELYEKLGVKKEIISRGKHAAYQSDYRGYSDEELEKLRGDIDAFYEDFVTKMAQARGRGYDEIDAVAQGRVWTGRQALEHGLVDELGGITDAFGVLRKKLHLPEWAPLSLISAPGRRRRWPLRLEWNFEESPLSRSVSEVLGKSLLRPAQLAALFARDRVLALLPFEIDFR